MRALFLVHNLPERGSYFRALEIARRMAARGHEVELVCISEVRKHRPGIRFEERIGDGTLRVVEAGYRTLFNERQEGWGVFDNGWRLWRALTWRPDFVYGFSHKPDCVLPALVARLRGAQVALDWSDWWAGPEGLYRATVLPSAAFASLPRPIRWARRAVFVADSWLEGRSCGLAHAVTLISQEYFSHPAAPRGLRERSLVMHSGAPLESIRPMERDDARRACGIEVPAGVTVFGYVGNFHPDERMLLEAFALVCESRPESRLLVVGSDFEALTPDLQRRIGPRLCHAGRRPFAEMSQWLGAADVLVLPLSNRLLNRARYPHKLSDYVAAGRPLVACDVGETGRLLRRFGIGRLAAPSAGALAEAMVAAADNRAGWRAEGAAVRAAAEQYFHWDRMCEQLFAFLSQHTGLTF
ncbi:MAG: glycosyltransferase [Candidatus Sumerlaeaceae bacterium]|nr:glycosyltransferase [Candidatus Sumerlaeaceae bacterium]